jgi:hypothetical protein
MLELAGKLGDGAILIWLSADDVKTVVPYVNTVLGILPLGIDPRQATRDL